MKITTELTIEEQRACDLVGNDFHSWLMKRAQKMLNLVMEQAKQIVIADKSLTEVEEMIENA